MKKILIGLISSSALTFVGIWLRLSAQAIAWPKTYQYSDPRADNAWARQEDAIGQVGLVFKWGSC